VPPAIFTNFTSFFIRNIHTKFNFSSWIVICIGIICVSSVWRPDCLLKWGRMTYLVQDTNISLNSIKLFDRITWFILFMLIKLYQKSSVILKRNFPLVFPRLSRLFFNLHHWSKRKLDRTLSGVWLGGHHWSERKLDGTRPPIWRQTGPNFRSWKKGTQTAKLGL